MGLEDARELIVGQVGRNHPNCEVKGYRGFICIRLPQEERHFWTPRLHISLETDESGNTQARGTFGPNANVWSLYLYGYLIIGIVAMFSGMFGACQLFVGVPAWGLWVFSGMLVCALSLYLASRIGQRIASPQSKFLEKIYAEAVGQTIEVR